MQQYGKFTSYPTLVTLNTLNPKPYLADVQQPIGSDCSRSDEVRGPVSASLHAFLNPRNPKRWGLGDLGLGV